MLLLLLFISCHGGAQIDTTTSNRPSSSQPLPLENSTLIINQLSYENITLSSRQDPLTIPVDDFAVTHLNHPDNDDITTDPGFELTHQESAIGAQAASSRALLATNGTCGQSQSRAAASCTDILNNCGLSRCVRWLQSSFNPTFVYQAYCDDDGWTLAMKIDGSNTQQFQYASPYWTNRKLLNSDASFMDPTTVSSSKFEAFVSSSVTAVRLMMSTPGTSNFGTPVDMVPKLFEDEGPKSLVDIFMQSFTATNAPLVSWRNILPGGISYQDNCNLQGFNVHSQFHSYGYSTVRLGIFFNNENDCYTPDSGAGVGVDSSPTRVLYVLKYDIRPNALVYVKYVKSAPSVLPAGTTIGYNVTVGKTTDTTEESVTADVALASCGGTTPLQCNLRTAWTYCLKRIVDTRCEGTEGGLLLTTVRCEIDLPTEASYLSSTLTFDADTLTSLASWSSTCPSAHPTITIKSSSRGTNAQIASSITQVISLESAPMFSLGLVNISLATGGVSVSGLEGFSTQGVVVSGTATLQVTTVDKVTLVGSSFSGDTLRAGIVSVSSCTDVSVHSCSFANNYVGLETSSNVLMLVIASSFVSNSWGIRTASTDQHVSIKYCYFATNNRGLELGGNGFIFASRFVTSGEYDAVVNGYSAVVSHCEFVITGPSISITGDGAGVVIGYSRFTHQVGNANYRGGVVVSGNSMFITGCMFSGTGKCARADWQGGESRQRYGALDCAGCTLVNSTFSNFAWHAYAGAVKLHSGHVTGCTFQDNSAFVNGGGLNVDGSSGITIEDSKFIGNTAGEGSAISLGFGGSLTIRGCQFLRNADGPALYLFGSHTVVIESSSFVGNTAGACYFTNGPCKFSPPISPPRRPFVFLNSICPSQSTADIQFNNFAIWNSSFIGNRYLHPLTYPVRLVALCEAPASGTLPVFITDPHITAPPLHSAPMGAAIQIAHGVNFVSIALSEFVDNVATAGTHSSVIITHLYPHFVDHLYPSLTALTPSSPSKPTVKQSSHTTCCPFVLFFAR